MEDIIRWRIMFVIFLSVVGIILFLLVASWMKPYICSSPDDGRVVVNESTKRANDSTKIAILDDIDRRLKTSSLVR